MLLSNNQITYPSIYYRVLFYLLSAHFIVAYGEPENLFELLKLSYYYFALIGSYIITLFIGEYVFNVTKYLDRLYPQFPDFYKRVIYQALWGIIVAVLLAVIMLAIYFWFIGRNIPATSYFRYGFIVGFILSLNALYLIIGLVQYQNHQVKIRIPNKEKRTDIIDFNKDIVAIYPVGRGFIAVLKSGESIIWTKTIGESLKELPANEYFLINRSDIISRYVIEGYEPSHSRRLKLILKASFTSAREFYVSQRKAIEFKHWYKNDSKS